jgi:uroporphyrinogen decarboxylase
LRSLTNDLVLRAARGERTARTPVWMMRQAGRFDPAYRALREEHGAPLEVLFRTPEIAAEISLLPRRFGVDAIIFYQDILTPLTPMGADFVFRPGPTLADPPRDRAALQRLTTYDPAAELPFVPETLRQVREALGDEMPLLGFAGAPLTLACFVLEGGSPGNSPTHTQALMQADPDALHAFLGKLADMTADYLALQIEAGIDALQLFESCSDLFSAEQYRTFAHPYQTRTFERLGNRVPRILYAKEQPDIERMAETGAEVLSLGKCVNLADARRRLGNRVALQGNVDNQLLVHGSFAEIDAAVKDCIHAGQHTGHILNLNHGVLKETPFENGCRFIDTARQTICTSTSEPEGNAP